MNKYLHPLNPLLPNGNYIYRIFKIPFFFKEGIMEKISYELYESVDDESLS